MDSAHRHAWSIVDFGVADGRPLVRQACACGATRTVSAWDRSWTPPARWRLLADGPLGGRLMVSEAAPAPADEPMLIDVWADIACPWCYIGFANLESAIAQLESDIPSAGLRVAYHSFELDPDAPLEFAGVGLRLRCDGRQPSRDQIEPAHARDLFNQIDFARHVGAGVYGRGIGVSQAALLVSVAFWTWFWGPVSGRV